MLTSTIFIDADACPVKDEVYRVAERYLLPTVVVANKAMRVPASPRIRMEVVPGDFDAADDWIVENAGLGDIVITSDILLAQRCVKKSIRALGPRGDEFTEDNVGDAVAMRELLQNLRQMGEMRGGPPAMDKQARSRFLGKLDQMIQTLKRNADRIVPKPKP